MATWVKIALIVTVVLLFPAVAAAVAVAFSIHSPTTTTTNSNQELPSELKEHFGTSLVNSTKNETIDFTSDESDDETVFSFTIIPVPPSYRARG